MVKQYSQLYLEARRAFLNAGEDTQSASLLARNLTCHLSGKTLEQLLADQNLYAGEDICQEMEKAVERVRQEEPLAYVLGEWEFYGLPLYVDDRVLIPRDDTCAVTELAINQALFLDQDPRVLDLCTGSGCIGLAIASRVRDARVTLADVSRDALTVAKKNVTLCKMTGRVTCVTANALRAPAPFLGKFDLIVSNPPYVTQKEMEELPKSVKDFEPHLALYGGPDGLDFYRAIAKNYAQALKPGGYLAFEFGMGQGNDVCKILEENQYQIVERKKDFSDIERAVIAQYCGKEEE